MQAIKNGTIYGDIGDIVKLVEKAITNESNKEEYTMRTIRQEIREVQLSQDERLLRRYGVVDRVGALTAVGRRVLGDILFEEYRDELVKRVQLVEDEQAERVQPTPKRTAQKQ